MVFSGSNFAIPGQEPGKPAPPFTPQEVEQLSRKRKRLDSESPRELSELTGFNSPSSEPNKRKRQKRSLTLWTSPPKISSHDLSNYTVLKDLGVNYGNGNAGLAIVRHKGTNDVLVRKLLRFSQSPSTTNYLEVRIHRFLSEVPHCNIVRSVEAYAGYAEIPVTIRKSMKGYTGIIYMPLCNLGSLEGWFINFRRKPFIPEAFWWHVLIEMMSGITYLQTGYSTLDEFLSAPSNQPTVPDWTPIAHMDAHSRNIFLTTPDTPDAYPKFFSAILAQPLSPKALQARLMRTRDMRTRELMGILGLHLQSGDPTKEISRFDIRNVASMIRDVRDKVDLMYVPLSAGAGKPSNDVDFPV